MQPIVSVVRAKGDLNIHEMRKICNAIAELTENPQSNRFVLDWGEVDYINPWAIGVLLSRTHALRQISGEIKFARMNSLVREIFSKYRVGDLFENYGTIEDAIESFDEEWLADGTEH